jgi:dTDP-4-dehydrorhamnose reductase
VKVLVTGAGGQLGTDVVSRFMRSGHSVEAHDRASLDLTDADAVRLAVTSFRPDTVVNCAAFTAVDQCESDVDLAFAVNEAGVRHLAEACDSTGAHMIHIGTDYVFDGELDRPYRFDDEPNPKSVYGRSKLAGERAGTDVLGDRFTVVRTSWVCGEHGNNMVKLVRRLAPSGNEMKFVDDQRGCPTFTTDLADALLQLVVAAPGGIIHLTNAGPVSWFEFVREILDVSGFDPDLVSPISTSELDPPRPAPRPANSVLDNVRWTQLGHQPLRDFREPLAELVARL